MIFNQPLRGHFQESVMEIYIKLEDNGKFGVSNFEKKNVCFHIQHKYGTAHVTLTRDQTKELVEGLQKILSK